MAAHKGNEYWKKRAKDGRDKIYQKPEDLLNEAIEYFKYCDDNPWYKKEAIKSGQMAGEILSIPTQRPYTVEGFCLFAGISLKGFKNYGNLDSHKDFFLVYTYIREVIDLNQLEGASVGAYNPNIIARKLSLVDKQENSIKAEGLSIKIEVPDNKTKKNLERLKNESN